VSYRARNFTVDEVIHRGGGFDPRLMPIAYTAMGYIQAIRDQLAVPIIITSGYRSPSYNQSIGGSPNSYHQWRYDQNGNMVWALDIASPSLDSSELYERVRSIVVGETYLHERFNFVHLAPYGNDEEWIS
jgi:uncharacterized protein YcbK (DUF882 family)